jgi:serine phosphatase RsbU (regulator of sigma subunit)/anti-sigma regulatory factor (Ser/Thr protein kinase)
MTQCFVVIIILLVILSAISNLRETFTLNSRELEAEARAVANNVRSLLDSEFQLENITSTEDKDFIAFQGVLKQFCKTSQMEYIYIYTLDEDASNRNFILCAALEDFNDETALNEYSMTAIKVGALFPIEEDYLDGTWDYTQNSTGMWNGDTIVWTFPYRDPYGACDAFVGMNYDAPQFVTDVLTRFLKYMIPQVLLTIVCMLFMLRMMHYRIVIPINEISQKMQLFSKDSTKKLEPLNIPKGDEIGDIADSFEKMTEDISTYVNNIETLTRDKLETDVQLGIARRIQYGLVPEKMNLEGNGFFISAMTRPAKAVGGDFYDCFRRNDGNVCIVMGDVSGKGITAAIFMSMMKTSIREKMLVGQSPSDALNRTNDELCQRNPENFFITVFAAVLDLSTGELCYSNAGHTSPIIIKKQSEYLEIDSGVALGIDEDADLTDYYLKLEPGEGIVLYTDGATDTINTKKEFFGKERLLDTVKNFSADSTTEKELTPSGKLVNALDNAITEFSEGMEAFDDTAILVLIYRKTNIRMLPVDVSSFEEIKKAVIEIEGNTPKARQILLACDEVLSNIARYSGATTLSCTIDKSETNIKMMFIDDGVPFDQSKVKVENRDFDELDSGGMGLRLIRQSVESMAYERSNGKNILTLIFSI